MMSLRLLTDQILIKSRLAIDIITISTVNYRNNNNTSYTTASNNNNNNSIIHNRSLSIADNNYIIAAIKRTFTTLTKKNQFEFSKSHQQQHPKYRLRSLSAFSTTSMDYSSYNSSNHRAKNSVNFCEQPFLPRRALILRKFSRLEYERFSHPYLTEEQLKLNLGERGSDYESLKHYDRVHKTCLRQIESALSENMIEFQTVDRHGYTEERIDWADVIITSGGDGTFLMAASKVLTRDKPVIGVNSDPTKSVGHLCLPKEYSADFKSVIQLLKDGRYMWQYRQRLRITLIGEAADEDPRELNDIRNNHRRTNHYLDQEDSNDQPSSPARSRSPMGIQQIPNLLEQQQRHSPWLTVPGEQSKQSYQTIDGKVFNKIQQVKEKALNEMFVGEALSARVSYFELSINNNRPVKVKSSGLAVCTGTGSTSWNLNMNKLTPHQVQSVVEIIRRQKNTAELQDIDTTKVAEEFNEMLTFPATKPIMAYSIRDPVNYATGPGLEPRGYPKRIEVKSRMQDGCLVLDSRQTYAFNDGSYALIEMYDEDALKTISV